MKKLLVLFMLIVLILNDQLAYWILYKDYPYINCERVTDEQLEALEYFDNFGYDYIEAEQTNSWIKENESRYVVTK